jgi:glycosyltransferase involved in cell wall biosynthesis
MPTSFKLISHVNGDNDLIEAWLKYYLELGVDRFHFVVHGSPEDNHRLLAIQDSYPITIEDTYAGSFHIEEKKRRLNAVLARYTEQWIVLVDSDEFVEFPYPDIPETIRKLTFAQANLMAAPMLQRLTADGSIETPPVIDGPFEMFPFCSVDLYRRMGVKGDIFKFPLFFCASGTRLAEGGNHHPPIGSEPHGTALQGVTHHFKFRRVVSERLENRIHSAHPWRHESVQFREYLASHSNRLPLEGAFRYSREELFGRRLLRRLPGSELESRKSSTQTLVEEDERGVTAGGGKVARVGRENDKSPVLPKASGKKILFVLPKTTEFGGLELHLFDFLRRLRVLRLSPVIVCFDRDIISARMDGDQLAQTEVQCANEPKSLRDWMRLIRGVRPDIIVFCYNWIRAFPWQAPAAALLAGVRRRFSIQHLIPPPPPPPVEGKSPANVLRRWIGGRARYLLKINLSGHVCNRTICVSDAVRDSLVRNYRFPARKIVTIRNGVSISRFVACECAGATVKARFDVDEGDFLLVCVARLSNEKGIDLVVHAVSRVLRQGIPCKCIILGDGPLKDRLVQERNSLGLWNHVFFEGFQKDVRPYLQAASAFILTSHLEGLPLSVLEAMACGLPCIVTDVGGSAEAVRDQVTGLVIPPGSLDATEEAVLYLATHPQERAEMAKKARETACRYFDIDERMSELRQVILD